MNQIKIGRFISECRKNKGLTQMQLAEMLSITDRAVSKWENGKAMPDSSIMLDLCRILGISVNDLLCGERVTMENYNSELENNLLEMIKEKEIADKRLLLIEVVTGIICVFALVSAMVIALLVPMEEWMAILVTIAGLIPLLIATPFMIRIEQTAGYYKCSKCGHKYVPKYSSVFISMHFGRTRYMRCPKCNKRSWNKKVLERD